MTFKPPELELAKELLKVMLWPFVSSAIALLLDTILLETSLVLLDLNCSVPPPNVMLPPPAKCTSAVSLIQSHAVGSIVVVPV